MTYGWAVLVVLVAIGSLAYFGYFRRPSTELNEAEKKRFNEMVGRAICPFFL